MIYFSIDLETTGLNPHKHQILEIGAIKQQLGGDTLGFFRRVIKWDTLVGSPYALNLNSRLLKEMLQQGEHIKYVGEALRDFAEWLGGTERKGVVAAGKNFASFDKQFLIRHKPFKQQKIFKHRSLDPVNFYTRVEDIEPPSLTTCLERANIKDTEITHNALDDAWQVIQCIEAAYANYPLKPDFE